MSGSLHLTCTTTYHLSIALLMVSHQEIGLTRVIRNVTHNASTTPYNSYKHNAKYKAKFQNKRQGYWLNVLGLALVKSRLVSTPFDAC
jgi:hypothetical protein